MRRGLSVRHPTDAQSFNSAAWPPLQSPIATNQQEPPAQSPIDEAFSDRCLSPDSLPSSYPHKKRMQVADIDRRELTLQQAQDKWTNIVGIMRREYNALNGMYESISKERNNTSPVQSEEQTDELLRGQRTGLYKLAWNHYTQLMHKMNRFEKLQSNLDNLITLSKTQYLSELQQNELIELNGSLLKEEEKFYHHACNLAVDLWEYELADLEMYCTRLVGALRNKNSEIRQLPKESAQYEKCETLWQNACALVKKYGRSKDTLINSAEYQKIKHKNISGHMGGYNPSAAEESSADYLAYCQGTVNALTKAWEQRTNIVSEWRSWLYQVNNLVTSLCYTLSGQKIPTLPPFDDDLFGDSTA